MICYRLICDQGHEFDSWFAGSDAFDKQSAQGLVSCGVCGSLSVEKALMAPAVSARAAPLSTPDTPAEAALRKLREKIEAESDYVGKEFVDEARKIHLGEAEARAIWGEATPEDAEALREEGVPVAPLPFMRRAQG